MRRAIVSWSGGKDCALALWHVRERFEIAALLTTVTRDYRRVSMHGVRVELLRAQAAALGLPLILVEIPAPCPNEEYERAMRQAWADLRSQGVTHAVCGDIFLADVRRYREDRLFGAEACEFPLWGRDSRELADEFLGLGFRATLCCVDTQALPASLAGRDFDAALLAELPPGADPCGENGEFHTFVTDGPSFAAPVPVVLGERVLRDGRFAYVDLLPATAGHTVAV